MTIDSRLIELWERSRARENGVSIEDFRTTEIENPASPKIGFCTNIMGEERFDLFLVSLKHNLEVFDKVWRREHYKPNAQFVILAYGEPELEHSICRHLDKNDKKNFLPWLKEAIENEIVAFAKTEAVEYGFAEAKNAAARTAAECYGCKILCTLDGDNCIGTGGNRQDRTEHIPDFITFLRDVFHQNPDSIVRPVHDNGENIGYPYQRGIGGRIATTSELFYAIRGYDEENNNPWGGDDRFFMARALAYKPRGYDSIQLVTPQDPLTAGDVLSHPHEYSWKNMPEEHRIISSKRDVSSTKRWAEPIKAFGGQMATELAYLQAANFPSLSLSPLQRIPVRYANPEGLGSRQVQTGTYNAKENRFTFRDHTLLPIPPIGRDERFMETNFSPEKVEAIQQQEKAIFISWIKDAFSSMPEFDREAIIYAAEKRRKSGGYEPIERVAYTLVNQTSDPSVLQRFRDEYQAYLDDRELLNPEQEKQADESAGFVQRYGNRSSASPERV